MADSTTSQSFETLLQQQATLLCDLEKQLKELKLTHKKIEKCFSECPVAKSKNESTSGGNGDSGVPAAATAVVAVKPARRAAVPRAKKPVAKAVPVPDPVQ